MALRIISEPVSRAELTAVAEKQFGDLVKAVVDVGRGVMAVGGELHADEEALLIEEGSRQEDLWGINLYPNKSEADWMEFDSMINVRPSQGNLSRSVESAPLRERIREIVAQLIH